MIYSYTAKNKDGELIKGDLEEANEANAVKLLRSKGLIILNIAPKKLSSFFGSFGQKVGAKDKIIFFQELSMMLKSGLPLVEALEALQEQSSNPRLSKISSELSVAIKSGKNLSEAMRKYPDVFPEVYLSIISSGEKSGKLDEVMTRLTDQMLKDYDLSSKVSGALMYPALILTAIGGVLLIVVIYIIPQVKKIFEEMDVPLPLVTRIILGASTFVSTWWWLILLIIIGLVLSYKPLTSTKSFKTFFDKMILRLPIIKDFLKKIYMARFTRNMGTLIASGLPMIEALEINKGIIDNVVYQAAFDRISKELEGGVQLSGSMKKEKIFPAMVYQLLNIGEKTGKIDKVLNDTADFFDREVENTTKNFTTILEPVLTIIMGMVVAAVIIPIYSLVNTI